MNYKGEMIFTRALIEAMGYSEYPLTDLIEVHFGILRAYSLRGMRFEQNSEVKQSKVISIANRCTIVIAQSINKASEMLVGEVFTEDEQKWLSDRKVEPPFLLIYFREAFPKELRGGYRQEKDGYIFTYDAFPEGKKEITEWEDEAIPGIVTSLIINFSTLGRPIDLVLIERSILGITSKGQKLFNHKLTGGVVASSVSSPKKLEEIDTLLEKSKELLPVLTKDVCRNFYEALNEPDKMKQFLGYFQFIEKYTNITFKSLNYSNDVQEVFNVPDRIKEQSIEFFKLIFRDQKNLSQRFCWCSIFAWGKVEDSDIVFFLEIKDIRNAISHGDHIEEKDLPVDKAKVLALKLLGHAKPNKT
jgi:hypothetical protein